MYEHWVTAWRMVRERRAELLRSAWGRDPAAWARRRISPAESARAVVPFYARLDALEFGEHARTVGESRARRLADARDGAGGVMARVAPSAAGDATEASGNPAEGPATPAGEDRWANLAHSCRVVAAVFRQRWRNNLRYPLNFVTQSLIGPISWFLPAYFMGRAFAPDGRVAGMAAYTGSADYMTYLLVGGIVASFIGGVLWGMGYALKTQMDQGVLEANWLTPASRFAQLVGLSAFNLVYTGLQLSLFLVVATLLFGFHPTGSFLQALGFLVPVFLGLYGFGFAFAGMTLLMRDPNQLIDVSDFLVSFLSGSQFPVAVLPAALLAVSMVLPTTYAIDGLRGILMHTETLAPIHTEFAMLCVLAAVLLVFGAWFFSWLERFCRVRGTIALR